jgi:hypothetical protein
VYDPAEIDISILYPQAVENIVVITQPPDLGDIEGFEATNDLLGDVEFIKDESTTQTVETETIETTWDPGISSTEESNTLPTPSPTPSDGRNASGSTYLSARNPIVTTTTAYRGIRGRYTSTSRGAGPSGSTWETRVVR